ncbi:exonuclease domain-containing protein [Patescibacteria group bacterium]
MNKNKLVFLDTETTGLGSDGRLCQVAYNFQGKEFDSLFKPPVPIEVEAMSVTHITNKMVEDKEKFEESSMQKDLMNIFSEGNILVAHNAIYDADILRKEEIEIDVMIDTLKVAYHLDFEGEIPKYNLQYLRYYFDLEVGNASAHDALGDIRVLEALFNHYFNQMMEKIGDEGKVLAEMIEVSSRPVLIKKFNFGKYNSEKVGDVARMDRGYLEWLLGAKIKARDEEGDNDENWIYTLEHYLK